MTQPELKNLLPAQAVAEVLGVSPMRVRQMVAEGKLPEPVSFGPRMHLWNRGDIEFVRARMAGQAPTIASSVLRSPLRPLNRVLEEVLELALRLSLMSVLPVHVRVWHGPAPEGERTIVLLGQLSEGASVYAHRGEVMDALGPMLPVPVDKAVWFLYHPDPRDGGQEVDNLILLTEQASDDASPTARVRHFFRTVESRSPAVVDVQLRPTSVGEVERVVGAAVEAYPPSAYTRLSIERWTRVGETVDVVHDVIDYHSLITAARTLDATLADADPDPKPDSGADPEDGSPAAPALALSAARREVLDSAVHLLTDEIRGRHTAELHQRFWDGTTPGLGFTDELPAGWPTTWAARLVRPDITEADQGLIDRRPNAFRIPRDPARQEAVHALLEQLRDWAEEVDRFSEQPDKRLHDALKTAADLIAFYLGVYDRGFPQRDHPADVPYLHRVEGRQDRAYLASLTPVSVAAGTEHARSRRMLLEVLGGWAGDHSLLGEGLDADGRLVLYYPTPAATPATGAVTRPSRRGRHTDGPRWYAVRWPLHPPAASIPAGTHIVADSAVGDRPVYLLEPTGRITPLPGDPAAPTASQWNFGYSGGGSNALINAIISLFTHADHIARDKVPTAWINDQLTYPNDNELDLAVDELRRRYR